MQNVALTLIVNIMMAGLLLATMIYCRRLNKRIRVLQDSRSELARIIRDFNESTERATQSIADIHEATSRLSENIQHKIDRANYLATDLDMLIDKGTRLSGSAPSPSRPAAAPPPVGAAPRESAAARSPRPEPGAMEAAAGNVSTVAPLADGGRRARPRSRAEQELMSVLQPKTDGR